METDAAERDPAPSADPQFQIRVEPLHASAGCAVLQLLDADRVVLTLLTTDPERDAAEAISILAAAAAQERTGAREG